MSQKVIVKIKEMTEKNGISLRGLYWLTDIRHAALNELVNHNFVVLPICWFHQKIPPNH